MLYSLPNGKVIEISVEQYLDMDDEEFEFLLSINYGEPIEDPFFGSILESKNRFTIPDEEPITPPEQDLDTAIDFTPEED